MSGILDLEECIQRDVNEDLYSDISSVDKELLSSTRKVENELLQQRFPAFGKRRLRKYGGELIQNQRVQKGRQDGGKSFLNVAKSEKLI